MLNKYSSVLFAVTVSVFLFSGLVMFMGVWFGFIFFIPSVLILTLGWIQLSGSSDEVSSVPDKKKKDERPRQVGLMKLLGRRTGTLAEGIILTLEFFSIEIVTVSVFDIVLWEDKEPFVIKGLLCKGQQVYVDATVSIGFKPDISDDPPCKKNGETAAQKLARFDDARGYLGVMNILRSSVRTQAQYIASQNTREDMESMSEQISIKLVRQLNGTDEGENNPLVTAAGLGIVITKIDFNAYSDDSVRKAADDIVVEALQRTADLADVDTIDASIKKMQATARRQGKRLSYEKAWDIIYKSRLAKAGKTTRTEIDGGKLLNFHNIDGAKGGKS